MHSSLLLYATSQHREIRDVRIIVASVEFSKDRQALGSLIVPPSLEAFASSQSTEGNCNESEAAERSKA